MRTAYIFLIIAILSEVIATTTLKTTEGFTRLVPSVIVILGYSCSFYFLSLALKFMAVGIVYAIWSGVGIIAVSFLGYLVYGQKLDLPAAIGMGLIIAGVIVIQLFSQTVAEG